MRATKQPWGAERTQIAGFTVQKGKPRWSKGVGLIQGHPSGYHCCLATKSCPTLCNPMDCSPPDSSVHGILQARKLEWVAISFSTGSSWPRDWTCVSCVSCIGRHVLYQLSIHFVCTGEPRSSCDSFYCASLELNLHCLLSMPGP